HIAVAEAQKLNIPIFAMVDTNSDPRPIDYVIPSNDDASKSIDKVLTYLTNAISEGLEDRKNSKEKEAAAKEAAAKAKAAKAAEVAEAKVKAKVEEKEKETKVTKTVEKAKKEVAKEVKKEEK
ncbi:MAG: 30S ribosomal protein S2, partial [Flavobacteriaceae bacterium]|nr:30S ribosomal protein S2 [Flavobacteriaceae bacterium]